MIAFTPLSTGYEENVYKLIETMMGNSSVARLYAVFISNPLKNVPVFFQKSSNCVNGLVVWDYHVIAIERLAVGNSYRVYDLDSTLSFPCDATQYWRKAIRSNSEFPPKYERYFRIVDGDVYLRHFASNRSHMREAGGWLAPPPVYEAISTAESTHNLPNYINISHAEVCLHSCSDDQLESSPFGRVLAEDAFCSFFNITP
ncbi:unnamed protein product [Mesocestoides corti]|uniref:Protein N-terminal glutamine amidohydrolase n=1 Tax=Mesocestoides corti TaxID=53468 RepID=A0A0R3UG17_MESCO|nr:unnamed protein product [Mesocestoides corti]